MYASAMDRVASRGNGISKQFDDPPWKDRLTSLAKSARIPRARHHWRASSKPRACITGINMAWKRRRSARNRPGAPR